MENSGNNTLYPIFLKLNQLSVLIIGGGEVGLEKASFMLKNSPDANITLLSDVVHPGIYELSEGNKNLIIINRRFVEEDLIGRNFLILATNDIEFDRQIKVKANKMGILVNAADLPDLCDFYLGSIISKGDLKIAISTNGQSPTLAKRLRQYLEAALPDNTQETIVNLNKIRNQLSGDLKDKMKALNNLTNIIGSTDKKYLKN